MDKILSSVLRAARHSGLTRLRHKPGRTISGAKQGMQPGNALPYYEGYTSPVPMSGVSGVGNSMQPPPARRSGFEPSGNPPPGVCAGPPPAPPPMAAKDEEAFARMYVLQEEIGRGAFSVVHRCTNRVTGEDFAVKIIDLRPLQLRESFDQTRLRREVEIMQRLQHPNVIRLEDVFETPRTMMLVLEYARGTELFDSILQKKKYPEVEARPIFEQLARALEYLHSLNIVHRDIKPENVVLLDKPSPQGYIPFAKLLDFGLSKMIGQDDGSAARTFVGTPCYLAPEVEARAYGQGRSYGTKVDCWSLGAVLYVMLVARFPEFDRTQGLMRVKLDSPLWNTVSESAKDLIRCLMTADPDARYSIQQVRTNYTVGPGTKVIRSGATEDTTEEERALEAFTGEQLNLLPLVNIQHSIAQSIELAHRACVHSPEDADDIKRSAILCRSQLIYTIKLLKKIERTATSVLDMFPDLELAVEDGEPTLAHSFFTTVKDWVGELRRTVSEAQHRNHESMIKLHKILVRGEPASMDGSTTRRCESPLPGFASMPSTPYRPPAPDSDDCSVSMGGASAASGSASVASAATSMQRSDSVDMADAQEEKKKTSAAVGSGTATPQSSNRHRVRARDEISRPHSVASSSGSSAQSPAHEGAPAISLGSHGREEEDGLINLDGDLYQVVKKLKEAKERDEPISENQLLDLFFPLNNTTASEVAAAGHAPTLGPHPAQQPPLSDPTQLPPGGRPLEQMSSGSSSASEGMNGGMGLMRMSDSLDDNLGTTPEDVSGGSKSQELSMVLAKLRDVDNILEHLAIFWAQTEVILDVLLQKSDHVERFVEFAHKPRLLTRFRQRMSEYKRFWTDVQTMCKHFTSSVNQQGPPVPTGMRYYGFLEGEGRAPRG